MKSKEKIISYLGLIVLMLMFFYIGYMECHYTRIAQYMGNGKFVDSCGYKWSYDGDFTVGNHYELKMFDNHTDSIYDDVIKEVR